MTQITIMLRKMRRWDIILFVFSSLIFIFFPSLDLVTSQWFYDEQAQVFIAGRYPWAEFVYWFFAKFKFLLLPCLIGLAIYFYRHFRHKCLHRKWIFSFLLCSLLLGPGVLVNIVLKDNSIGRARPVQIVDFGGKGQFTRAFEYSGQCQKNCSFVSGHAALGFFFIGLGWVLKSRLAFIAGLLIGSFVGGVRIMQGGHFLSDVVLAFWAVYWVNWLLARQFNLANILAFWSSPVGLSWRGARL